MSKSIEDLIDTLGEKDHTLAGRQFEDIMLSKMSDALDVEKIRLAASIYNTVETEDDAE